VSWPVVGLSGIQERQTEKEKKDITEEQNKGMKQSRSRRHFFGGGRKTVMLWVCLSASSTVPSGRSRMKIKSSGF